MNGHIPYGTFLTSLFVILITGWDYSMDLLKALFGFPVSIFTTILPGNIPAMVYLLYGLSITTIITICHSIDTSNTTNVSPSIVAATNIMNLYN